MATVNYTGAKAQKFIKPDYIVATLFTGGETDNTPKGDSYILEDVIEDTTKISQGDNTTTDIECETSDAPIVSIVKLGKYQISAEVGDTQADLLKSLCGFIADDTGKKVFAPSIYQPLYVKFDIVYKNGDSYVAYVVPKAQLNSKVMIESLNSNLGRIAIAGTAQDVSFTIAGEKVIKTPFYIDMQYTLPAG